MVEIKRFELLTPCLQSRCSSQLSYTPVLNMVGLGRLELPTSRLSGVRSNHLSYKPVAVNKIDAKAVIVPSTLLQCQSLLFERR